MSSLIDIEPTIVDIKIGTVKKNLIFDLRAFAVIEKQIGSIKEAFKLLNENDADVISIFIWAGLLYQNPKTTFGSIKDKLNIEEAILKLQESLDIALSNDYNFLEQWDWALLYYTSTVTLNMSEETFWHSTPRKIISLLKIHGELKGKNSNNNLSGDKAVKAFMQW